MGQKTAESDRPLRILHLEDNPLDRQLVLQTLIGDKLKCEFIYAKNEPEFREALKRGNIDLILSDFTLPGYDGMRALAEARRTSPEIPFVFLSGTIGEERAVENLRAGATDCVLKDHPGRLSLVVRRALKEAEERIQRRLLGEQLRHAQKMEAVGQLAGGVAHDFNNLLMVIRGNAEVILLSEENLSATSKECLSHVVVASERAADLTRQLLAFGRKQLMQPRLLSLNDVIRDFTRMIGRVIGADVRLECAYALDLPPVLADAGMIEQVLLNLVVNARDAMPKGGTLSIATGSAQFANGAVRAHPEARPGSFVFFNVRDTGTGIASEHLARIFEPFFTTKEVGKGTGLGLATVYGIVKQHEGWVQVQSEVGKGTVFEIYLPKAEAPPGAVVQTVGLEKLPDGNERILLVEDDEKVRLLASRLLMDYGYTVWEAPSARVALELWRSHAQEVDLLLTDVVMPDGMTGRDLAERLWKERPDLKVIFTSGYASEVAGQDTEFVKRSRGHFLQKPYSIRTLLEHVRAYLDAKQGA